MADATIVIPFYNDPYVAEAVESALAQTHPSVEVIVVDDGSTSCAELLAPYLDRIHYIGKANGGTASALNAGFRLASGRYVAWLSSDDRFRPEKIARQMAAMEAAGAWIGHTAFAVIDGEGRVTNPHVLLGGGRPDLFYRAFVDGNPVNGCTVMMRKELFERLGGFNEGLPYTHDLDFWYRAMLAGFPFHYLGEPLTEYRMHDAMGTVRHREAIRAEVKATFARYAERWRTFLRQIGIAV
jgi:Glycosyltransferases involved in cell wall biogenesis